MEKKPKVADNGKKKKSFKALNIVTALAVATPAVVLGLPTAQAETEGLINHTFNSEFTTKLKANRSDYIHDVKPTSDGGYIAVGGTDSPSSGVPVVESSTDAIIMKYDSNGVQEWIKPWSGNGSKYDFFNKIVVNADGSYFALGVTSTNNPSLGITNAKEHIFIVKYTSEGDEVWSKALAGNNWETVENAVPSVDGGFVLVGRNYSTNLGATLKGESDALIVKYDNNGNRQWIKHFGGSKSEYGYGLINTSDGGYLISGTTGSSDVGLTIKGRDDAFLLKLDKNGNKSWVNSLGGDNWDTFYGVAELDNGDFMAVGYTNSIEFGAANLNQSALYAKFSKTGQLLWWNAIGGSKDEDLNTVIPTNDGGAMLFGSTKSNDIGIKPNDYTMKGMVIKIDADGKRQWITGLDSEIGTEIIGAQQLSDGEYLIHGLSRFQYYPTNGSVDGFITKGHFSKPANTPPKAGLIDSQEVLSGESMDMDLSNYFTDTENDELTYTATSSDGSLVTLNENILWFSSNQPGDYTVTVKANDGEYDSEEITFTVNVLPGNEPPLIVKNIDEQTVTAGQTLVLNANDYFTDPESDKLDYTITTSDTHDSSAWVTTNGELKFRSAQKGVYSVTVTATDGKGTTEPMTFKVTVTEAEISDSDIKPSEGHLDSVDVYKEVINVPLIGNGTKKTLFVDGLLAELDLDNTEITLKSTDNSVAKVFYNNENKTISFESVKKGFTNIQLVAEDKTGKKGVLLYLVDVYEKSNVREDYIADGEIRLGTEAYVVELDEVYSKYSNGGALTYNVTVSKSSPDTETLVLPPKMMMARASRTQNFVFEVPEGVTSTTLHEDADLLVRLINGKLVVEGKQVGKYDVTVSAETKDNPIPSTVKFSLDVLPQDNTGGGNTPDPTPPGNGSGGGSNGGSGSGDGGSGNGNDNGNGGGTGSGDGGTTTPPNGGDNNGTGGGNGSDNGNGSETTPPTGDLVQGEDGDLIISIKPGVPSTSDTVDIVVDEDSMQIGIGDKTYDSSISNGLASYAKKRVIRDEGNGVYTTVPHFVKDNKLNIKTKNPIGLVITDRVVSNFKDTKGLYSENEVEDLYNYLIVQGTTATTYSPNKNITRGQFSTMIARALELKPKGDKYTFDDASKAWYKDSVQALYEAGFITGFPDGTFGGDKTLSRQQAAAMIERMLKYMDVDTTPTEKVELEDMDRISDYAKSAVQYLASNDVLDNGKDTNFNPFNNLTRAQMAKVLMRSLQLSDWY